MAIELEIRQPSAEIRERVLPLENGDHLTRAEFERRYDAMPNLKKAELIEGVVYVGSPVRYDHGHSHAQIITWLGTYSVMTPGVDVGDNSTVRLDPDNEVQPDAFLRIEPQVGGHSRVTEDAYIEGAPELIVEVALSSASHDLHEKLRVYRRNGVQEYIVWRVYDNRLDWFSLREGEYVPLLPDENGLIQSQVFPGLTLAVSRLLEGDLAGVLARQQQSIGTPEHTGFVERLIKKEVGK